MKRSARLGLLFVFTLLACWMLAGCGSSSTSSSSSNSTAYTVGSVKFSVPNAWHNNSNNDVLYFKSDSTSSKDSYLTIGTYNPTTDMTGYRDTDLQNAVRNFALDKFKGGVTGDNPTKNVLGAYQVTSVKSGTSSTTNATTFYYNGKFYIVQSVFTNGETATDPCAEILGSMKAA